MLVSEICGELDEEKDTQEIKNRSIEFKKNKGIECFKMLASKIDFKSDSLKTMIDSFKWNFMKGS